VPEKVLNLLYDFGEDDSLVRQVFDTLNGLLELLDKLKREREMQKNGDMKISLVELDLSRI
jgi:hypothetical protein